MAAISSTTALASSSLSTFFKTGLLNAPLHPLQKYKHKDIDFARFVLSFVDPQTCVTLSNVNRRWRQLATPLFKFLRLFSEENIPGEHGEYSLKRNINRSEAREIFAQTGLEISIPTGQAFLKNVCLGRGQFGEFRIGYDLARSRYVGIKVVRECEHVESEVMIQRELSSHSHILPAIDSCQAISPEGVISLYQVMELAGLGSIDRLSTHLSSLEDLNFREMIHYWLVSGLIQGLGEMHKANICHLDMKPGNGVIRQDGRVLLIDFGCAAKMTDHRINIKECDGDMDFYAPERWLTERFPDRRMCDGTKVDMWAVGLILLSLIDFDIKTSFGKQAMNALVVKPNAERLLTNHVFKQLAGQSILRTPASDSLVDLILHLLHPDPSTRFTATAALEHPWCRKMALATAPHQEKISGYLREFVQSQQNKLYSHSKTSSKASSRIPGYSTFSPQELPLPHFTSSIDRPTIQGELVNRVFNPLLSYYLNAAPITVCQGIGGVGKTYLLTQFIHQPKVRDRFGLRLWFNESDNPQNIRIQLVILARELGLVSEKTPEDEAISRLQRYLSNYPNKYGKPWLAIFDNAEIFDSLKDLLPSAGGHILVSTRFPWADSIPIDVLSEHEAQTLVSKLLFRQDPHNPDLCRTLGYHPLGIVQACAYIRNHQLSIPAFLEELAGNTAFLERDERLFGKNLPTSVSGLWRMTFEKIRIRSPKAFEALELYAYLAPNHLPELIDSTPEIIALLKSYSLLQGRERLSIHQLLQMTLQAGHTPETQIGIVGRAMEQLFLMTKGGPMPEVEEADRQLLPHGKALLSHYMKLSSPPQLEGPWALTIFWMDVVQKELVSPLKKRKLLEKALPIVERCYGRKNKVIMSFAYYRLSLVYGELGEYKLAIEYSERQLANDRKTRPEKGDEPLILNNLGLIWHELGEYDRALTYHRNALAIFKKKYGEVHPHVALSLHNLGVVWYEMGDYKRAIECQKGALAINKEVYGSSHRNTTISYLCSLGAVYYTLGEYSLAIDILEQALTIHKVCGVEHSSNAISLNNSIGMTWQHLGQHQKAIEHLKRALAISNEFYGPDHPSIGMTLINLGRTYHREDKKEQAIEEYKKALAIFIKRDDEKNITLVLDALAEVLTDIGELKLFIDCYEWTLSTLIRVHGEEHTRVVSCLDTLGNACLEARRNRQAIRHFERALSITRRIHGELHGSVLCYLNNLGIAFAEIGDIPKAKDYLRQAYQLGLRLPNWGKNHPEVIKCKHSLDLILKENGYDELSDSEPLLGPKEESCCCTIS